MRGGAPIVRRRLAVMCGPCPMRRSSIARGMAWVLLDDCERKENASDRAGDALRGDGAHASRGNCHLAVGGMRRKAEAVNGDDENERAAFMAVMPSTVSAMQIHGDEGMRFQLDVDESNLAEALKIVMWRGKVLKVTIEPGE